MTPSEMPEETPALPIWTWEGFWQWSQTALGATIVGGLILALILLVISIIYRRVKKASFWRALPGWIWRALKWPFSLRVKTQRQLNAIEATGYGRHKSEMEEQRKDVRQPSWRVDQRGVFTSDDLYWLNNGGYPATDVSVTCDESEMVLMGQVFFPGVFGSMTGKNFEGKITSKGLEEGVHFTIEWSDDLVGRRSTVYHFPPDKLLVKDLETREEAYARGRADRQAELDEQRAVPAPKPRWRAAVSQSEAGRFSIQNTAKGTIARYVSLDAPSTRFVFDGIPEWDNMDGPRMALFRGDVTYDGGVYGVTITVNWSDGNGDRWTQETPLLGVQDPH